MRSLLHWFRLAYCLLRLADCLPGRAGLHRFGIARVRQALYARVGLSSFLAALARVALSSTAPAVFDGQEDVPPGLIVACKLRRLAAAAVLLLRRPHG